MKLEEASKDHKPFKRPNMEPHNYLWKNYVGQIVFDFDHGGKYRGFPKLTEEDKNADDWETKA